MAGSRDVQPPREKGQKREKKARSSSSPAKKNKPHRKHSSKRRHRKKKKSRGCPGDDGGAAPRDDHLLAGPPTTASGLKNPSPAACTQNKEECSTIPEAVNTKEARDDNRGAAVAPESSTLKSSSPEASVETPQRPSSEVLSAPETPRNDQPTTSAALSPEEKHSTEAQPRSKYLVKLKKRVEKPLGIIKSPLKKDNQGRRLWKWRSPTPPFRKPSATLTSKADRHTCFTTKEPTSAAPCVAETSERCEATGEQNEQHGERRKSSVRFGSVTQLVITPRTTSNGNDKEMKKLFAVVFLATSVAATSLFLIWAMWPHSKNLTKHCDSSECQIASEELFRLMDIRVSPCENFHRHVCGKVDDKAFGNTALVATAEEEMLNSFKNRLLSRKDTDIRYPVLDQLVAIFKSCHAFDKNAHPLADAGIKEAIADVTNILATKDTVVALRHVVRLSLLRGISTLYNVGVISHGGELCLYVSRGKSLHEKMGVHDDSDSLPEFLGQLFDYTFGGLWNVSLENATATVSLLLNFDLLYLHQKSSSEEAEMKGIAKAAFMENIAGEDWQHFVNSLLLPDLKLRNTSTLLATEIDVVNFTVDGFRKNYNVGLIYILIQIAVEIGRFYQIPPNRSTTMCLQLADEVLPPVWSTVFNNLTTPLMWDPSIPEAVFFKVRKVFAEHPVKIGIDKEDENLVVSHIKSVRLAAHDTTMSTSSNASVWHPTEVLGSPTALPTLHAELKAREARRRLSDPPSAEAAFFGHYFLSNSVRYSRTLNTIQLPAALRRPPVLYSGQVPIEFNMGVIGVLLAMHVFQAGEPPESSFEEWYRSNAVFFLDCMLQSKLLRGTDHFDNVTKSRVLHIFIWTYSLLVVHRAVRKHYEEQSEASNFRHFWQSAQQILFRRFCLLTCGGSWRNTSDESRLDCIIPIANSPEMFDAFGCSSPLQFSDTSCLSLE